MILYFTGTGNSQYAAEAIGSVLGEEPVSINEYLKKGEYPELISQTPWLIIAPTYAWRLPRVVEEFIHRSTFRGNREVRFVLTCGDSIGNAGAYAKGLCEKKGLVYCGMADLVMPENYITLFKAPDKSEEQSIMKEADQRLQEIIEDLQAGRDLTQRCGRQKLLSAVMNPCFYKLFVKAGPYDVKKTVRRADFAKRSVRWETFVCRRENRSGATTAPSAWHASAAVLQKPSSTEKNPEENAVTGANPLTSGPDMR